MHSSHSSDTEQDLLCGLLSDFHLSETSDMTLRDDLLNELLSAIQLCDVSKAKSLLLGFGHNIVISDIVNHYKEAYGHLVRTTPLIEVCQRAIHERKHNGTRGRNLFTNIHYIVMHD